MKLDIDPLAPKLLYSSRLHHVQHPREQNISPCPPITAIVDAIKTVKAILYNRSAPEVMLRYENTLAGQMVRWGTMQGLGVSNHI